MFSDKIRNIKKLTKYFVSVLYYYRLKCERFPIIAVGSFFYKDLKLNVLRVWRNWI